MYVCMYVLVHLGTKETPLTPLLCQYWVKKEGMTERRKASWASKTKPGPLLSSRSGSATGCPIIIIIIIYFFNLTIMKNFINKFSYKLKFTEYGLLVIKVIIIIIKKTIYNLF